MWSRALILLLVSIWSITAYSYPSLEAGMRRGSGYRPRMRRQEPDIESKPAATPLVTTSTTPAATPSQTINAAATWTSSTFMSDTGNSGTASTEPTKPSCYASSTVTENTAAVAKQIVTPASSNTLGTAMSSGVSSSQQPVSTPADASPPMASDNAAGNVGASTSSTGTDALHKGQIPLMQHMAVNVTAGGDSFGMMLDTAHACSWYVGPKNFTCDGGGLASKMGNTCNPEKVYVTDSPRSNINETRTQLGCQYELGNTSISGFAAFTRMNVTGAEPTELYYVRAAHSMSSNLYGLDNFLHGSAGVLSILPTPEGCTNDLPKTVFTWRDKYEKEALVYLAPRRLGNGILSRGEYPVSDLDIINSTAISTILGAAAINSSAYGTPGCSWGLPIDGLRVDRAVAGTSDTCIVDTMSRFNEIDPLTAGAIAAKFNPPGWYDSEVGRFEVACNATAPVKAVSIVLADKDFEINPLDMILKKVPPYYEDHCYSAFQATNYSANARCRLGWPLLRNVGLGFHLDRLEWNVTSRPYYKES